MATRTAPAIPDLTADLIELNETTVPSSGFIIFMPWVTLPESVRVGRFRFCPVIVKEVKSIVDPEMVATVEDVLKCYVRKNGKPIESCTIVLRAHHQQAWKRPQRGQPYYRMLKNFEAFRQ